MKALSVSKKWEYFSKQKTWVEIFEDTLEKYPDKEALVFVESTQRITYREYAERVNELAKGLFAIGVRKGMHVGIWMTNRPEWCFARLAIYKLGAIMVPIHTRYKTEELNYVLKQSDIEVLLMEDKFLGKIDAMAMFQKFKLREKTIKELGLKEME